MKVSKEFLDELRNDIGVLRDSSFHVCLADQDQKNKFEEKFVVTVDMGEPICTCEEFDKVIDKITKVFEEVVEMDDKENEDFESISDMRARADEWRREAEFFVTYEHDKVEETRCYAQADIIDAQADMLAELKKTK
jgi:hypothetical protein